MASKKEQKLSAKVDDLFPDLPPPPDPSQIKPLRLPVCIPQASFADSDMARAYPPELKESGVEMNDWILFIDRLNLALTASPPLRVVEVTGMVIGLVPNLTAMVVGGVVEFTATALISSKRKSLSDAFLKRANNLYFSPRGLRARLCKTAAMRRLIGLDPDPASEDPSSPPPKDSKGKKIKQKAGNWAGLVALHVPGAKTVYNNKAASVATIPSGIGEVTVRRIALLDGYALPVTLDVPPKEKREGKLADMEAKLQARSKKRDAEIDRKRQLLAIQEGRATSLVSSTPPLSGASSPASPPSGIASSQGYAGPEPDWKQIRKDMKDEQDALMRAQSGQVDEKLRKEVQIADRKEWKKTDMLLWLVVLNADEDARILGTDSMDDDEDDGKEVIGYQVDGRESLAADVKGKERIHLQQHGP